MPDAAGKLTLIFGASGSDPVAKLQGTPPTGWTETFFTANAISDPNLLAFINQYVKARVALLGVGATVVAARMSNIPPNRATDISFLDNIAKTGAIFTNTPEDDYDPTQVDLLMRLEGALNKRRQLWLGGLPDSQTNTLIGQGMSGAFLNSPAFKAYLKALTTSGLGIRYLVTKNVPPVPNVYGFDLITKATPIMVRKRNRGRPFFLFRGRRIA